MELPVEYQPLTTLWIKQSSRTESIDLYPPYLIIDNQCVIIFSVSISVIRPKNW